MADRWDTGRTEAFSDGVFAIAITLLVLDIRVPESAFEDLWQGMADQWPTYLAYLTSFLMVGGVWLAHHELFGRLRYVDATLMRLNLLLLLATSFLPFPTSLMADAISIADAERAAVVVYGTTLLVVSSLLAAMWRAVANRPQLLHADVDDQHVQAIMRAAAPNIGLFVLTTLVAIVAPRLAAFGYLVIAFVVVLRIHAGDRPAGAEGS